MLFNIYFELEVYQKNNDKNNRRGVVIMSITRYLPDPNPNPTHRSASADPYREKPPVVVTVARRRLLGLYLTLENKPVHVDGPNYNVEELLGELTDAVNMLKGRINAADRAKIIVPAASTLIISILIAVQLFLAKLNPKFRQDSAVNISFTLAISIVGLVTTFASAILSNAIETRALEFYSNSIRDYDELNRWRKPAVIETGLTTHTVIKDIGLKKELVKPSKAETESASKLEEIVVEKASEKEKKLPSIITEYKGKTVNEEIEVAAEEERSLSPSRRKSQ